MATVLRLQGLDVKAGTEDIRTFFKSLHIPDGGVYIVGGNLKEAFIAFTTEKDATLALQHTDHFLKGSKISLHRSSMEEMEHKLRAMLKRKRSSPIQEDVKRQRHCAYANHQPLKTKPHNPGTGDLPPTTIATTTSLDPRTTNQASANASPIDPRVAKRTGPKKCDALNLQTTDELDSSTAFLLGVCTVLQGLQSFHQRENDEPVSLKTHRTAVTEVGTPEKPGYVRVFGLPASTTKELISDLFKGLKVQEALVNVELGVSHGCLVKFANEQDAKKALSFSQQPLGIEIRGATEKMWISASQECETSSDDCARRGSPKQRPLTEKVNRKQTPATLRNKGGSVNQPQSKMSKPHEESLTALSPAIKYTIMVTNLPKTMTKTDIKELFGCPNIAHKNVLHLLDKEGNRTDQAFLILNRTEDYDYAMNLSGCHVGSNTIEVSSVTTKIMRDMMAKSKGNSCSLERVTKKPNQRKNSHLMEMPDESMNEDPAAQTCLFIRNMPADVQKNQIKRLFHNFRLKNENITLLLDREGNGTGEAVVQFKSPKVATIAQRLHGRVFLGTKVLLTCINVKQKTDILAKT